jgi:hypothetical protein
LVLGAESAGVRTARYEGHYEGVRLESLWSKDAVSASAGLSAYRLVRNGLVSEGIGDLALGAQVIAWRPAEQVSLGLSLVSTLPTGEARKSLGMGHVMLAPGVFANLQAGDAALALELGYARALSTDGHEHHRDFAPLVDPMNSSELGGRLSAAARLASTLRLDAALFGAVPTTADGSARLVAALGSTVEAGWVEAHVELQTPIVGDPFTAKLVLELAFSPLQSRESSARSNAPHHAPGHAE